MPTPLMKTLRIALVLTALAAPTGAVASSHAPPAEASAEGGADGASAVSLGKYAINDLRPAEGTKLRLRFELYAGVEGEAADALREKTGEYQQRIRNEVLIAIRLCEQHDFQEPNLDRVRRRILARLNRALPELAIDKLLVGEFEYFTD